MIVLTETRENYFQIFGTNRVKQCFCVEESPVFSDRWVEIRLVGMCQVHEHTIDACTPQDLGAFSREFGKHVST